MTVPKDLCFGCHGSGEALRFCSAMNDFERDICLMCRGTGFDPPTPPHLLESDDESREKKGTPAAVRVAIAALVAASDASKKVRDAR